MDQLKQLQVLVTSAHPSKTQAGTCLMVLFLAFGLVLFPLGGRDDTGKSSVSSYTPAIGEFTL